MRINLFTIDNGKEHSFVHDLNFATPRYDIKHVVAFKKPTPTQIAALRLSGPIPGDHQQDGSRKKPMIGVEDIPSSMGTPGGGSIVGGAVGVIGGSGGGLMTPSAASGVSAGKKRKSGLAGRDKLVRLPC